jgi:peptidoglycan LD-endopeptidase LytH
VLVALVVAVVAVGVIGLARWVHLTSGGGDDGAAVTATPDPDPVRDPDPVPPPPPPGTPKTAAAPTLPRSPGSPAPSSGPWTYVFPIEPPAAASYAREHHTYPATDIFAACGTTLVAVTDAVVDEVGTSDPWDPVVDDPATRSGRFVSLVGDDGVRYHTSHLEAVAAEVRTGARVSAGQAIGRVGRSGNAVSTPCHVHVGISPPLGPGDWEVRRGVIWPWPYLDAWRAGEPRSPAEEVGAWTGP